MLRLGIVMLLYTILRIQFYFMNLEHFAGAPFVAFLAGIRFDLAAVVLINFPVILLHIIPSPWRYRRLYITITKAAFYLCNLPALMLACADLSFYSFTLKRSTADIFELIMLGDDMKNLLPSFIRDYWFLLLTLILLLLLAEFLYKLTQRTLLPRFHFRRSLVSQTIIGAGTLVMWFIVGRGGVQLTPINILIAGNYVSTEYIPVVLNTPFTVMQTLGKQSLPQYEFYTEEELDKVYSTTRQYQRTDPLPENTNVVIVLLESFSNEYIGSLSGNKSYTPFLDSLFDHGLLFTNGFANGRRSIEVLPSVMSSIPGLMSDPYVISNYSGNKISSLASLLKEIGYYSSFYHGGKNGTMAFDDFCVVAGVDDYFGLDEYPHAADYDGNWGVYDEPYFQYVAQQLNERSEPFFSTFFSLSSHHPYQVPKPYADEFKDGEIPLHNTIRYTDMALGNFFKTASQMRWYENTLFVITADHTGMHTTAEYNNTTGNFRVPIFFFKPGSDLKGREDRVVQQIDIMPGVLDQLGYDGPFFAFGSSPFDRSSNGWAVSIFNDMYQLVQDDRLLYFDGTETHGMYDVNDWARQYDLSEVEPARLDKMVERTKAIVQRFNSAVAGNRLTVE